MTEPGARRHQAHVRLSTVPALIVSERSPLVFWLTGVGGFIGHHLVNYLKQWGQTVRRVDLTEPVFELIRADDLLTVDLRGREACVQAVEGVEEVDDLTANMGRIGYIAGTYAPSLATAC